jgi:soluble lytic murein transglycosylase-like protein
MSRADSSGATALRAEAQAYEHGEGLPKDVALAVQLYCEAARRGDAEAQFNLGWLYANGRGVARDDAVASYFFRLAAQQGHEYAARMLRFVGEPVSEMPECLGEKRVVQAQEATPASTTVVPDPMPEFQPVTPAQKKAVEIVKKLAPEYGVNPRLALAVIRAESNFDPAAHSVKTREA